MTDTASTPIQCFEDFETRFGAKVAEDVLQRLCEECFSRDSQYGVRVSDVQSLDALGDNHEATGAVEHDNVWYGFGIRYGTSYGTQIDYFELEEDAPEELASSSHPALLLQTGLNSFVQPREHLLLARGRSLSRLHALNPAGLFSSQPRLCHDLLGGVMGDIAVQCQDFVDDALPQVQRAYTSQQNLQDLFDVLSPELREHLEQHARQVGWQGTPKALLAAGLGYLSSQLLEPLRLK